MSGDLGELSEELQSLQALRRSSSGSRCIHEHHCGSQASVNSVKAGQGAHCVGRGSMELPPFRGDFQSALPPFRDLDSSLRKKSWPSMKPGRTQSHHGMGDRAPGRQDRVMEEEEEEEEDGRYEVYVRRAGSRRGNYEMAQQRSLSMDFWKEKTRLPQFWGQKSECHLPPQSGCVSLTFFIMRIIIKKCSVISQCGWETQGLLQSSAPGVFRNSKTLKHYDSAQTLKQPTGSCYRICDQCTSEDRW